RLHDDGVKLLQAGEYDKSIVRFEQVLEKIRWFPYPVSDAGIEKSARENIIVAKKKKREQEAAQRVPRERKAFDDAQKEEREQILRKKQLVEKLIRDGVEQIDHKQYEKAELTFTNVLDRDPNNEQAQKFLELAIEGRHVEQEIRTHQAKLKEDEKDW